MTRTAFEDRQVTTVGGEVGFTQLQPHHAGTRIPSAPAFTRTQTSASWLVADTPATGSATASRGLAFASTGTESSRSTITWSAPLVTALSNRSSRVPGR